MVSCGWWINWKVWLTPLHYIHSLTYVELCASLIWKGSITVTSFSLYASFLTLYRCYVLRIDVYWYVYVRWWRSPDSVELGNGVRQGPASVFCLNYSRTTSQGSKIIATDCVILMNDVLHAHDFIDGVLGYWYLVSAAIVVKIERKYQVCILSYIEIHLCQIPLPLFY